jgi:hypothetical protein
VVVLARATRRLRRPRGAGGGASGSPDQELRRARAIILLGLVIWAAIAVLVDLLDGSIASVVLVGWGSSGVLCFVFGVWPLGLAQRRSFAVEILDHDKKAAALTPVVPHHAVEPTTDVIDVVDVRDAVLDPVVAEEVRHALDAATGQ